MASDQPFPGVRRRSFSTPRATVTLYEFVPAAVFPRHRHSQEQITLIQRGEVRLTVGSTDHCLRAGGWSVVPPDVEHGLEAGEEGAEVLAIVIPARDQQNPYMMVQTGEEA